MRAKTKPWGQRNCLQSSETGLCRGTDLKMATNKFCCIKGSQEPPKFLNGRSLDQPGLFLELAACQTERSGEKGLGKRGDQEPDGHSEGAPEVLCVNSTVNDTWNPTWSWRFFCKLQMGFHVSFTEERLPSGHSAIKPRLVECCSQWLRSVLIASVRSHPGLHTGLQWGREGDGKVCGWRPHQAGQASGDGGTGASRVLGGAGGEGSVRQWKKVQSRCWWFVQMKMFTLQFTCRIWVQWKPNMPSISNLFGVPP